MIVSVSSSISWIRKMAISQKISDQTSTFYLLSRALVSDVLSAYFISFRILIKILSSENIWETQNESSWQKLSLRWAIKILDITVKPRSSDHGLVYDTSSIQFEKVRNVYGNYQILYFVRLIEWCSRSLVNNTIDDVLRTRTVPLGSLQTEIEDCGFM